MHIAQSSIKINFIIVYLFNFKIKCFILTNIFLYTLSCMKVHWIGNKRSVIIFMLFILSYLQMLVVLSLILLFQTTFVACKCCTK